MITAGKAKNNKAHKTYKKGHKKEDKKEDKKLHNIINDKVQDNTVKPVTVGLVHANWCGHCQHLMPEWDKMENNIKNDPKLNTKCDIVKIESENYNKEIPKYENMINQSIPVEGYPTIFLIKNRHIEKYGGDRTAEAISGWIAGAVNGHVGGKSNMKTKKTGRKSSKKCKSCKSFNLFKLW